MKIIKFTDDYTIEIPVLSELENGQTYTFHNNVPVYQYAPSDSTSNFGSNKFDKNGIEWKAYTNHRKLQAYTNDVWSDVYYGPDIRYTSWFAIYDTDFNMYETIELNKSYYDVFTDEEMFNANIINNPNNSSVLLKDYDMIYYKSENAPRGLRVLTNYWTTNNLNYNIFANASEDYTPTPPEPPEPEPVPVEKNSIVFYII